MVILVVESVHEISVTALVIPYPIDSGWRRDVERFLQLSHTLIFQQSGQPDGGQRLD